jgi:CheY-like chemotaxis protein
MANILVLQTESQEAQVLSLLLEIAGHICTAAGSLQEARNLLQTEEFDLVLSESCLGDCGSNQITRTLKAVRPNITMMFLGTSAAGPTGTGRVLTLPCLPEHLFRRIEHALDKSAGGTTRNPAERRGIAPKRSSSRPESRKKIPA